MKNNYFSSNKKPIKLAKKIGHGGEGNVYLIEGTSNKAAKIYHKHDRGREEKISAMLRFDVSSSSKLVSYPEDILCNSNGQFSGIIMPFFDGYKSMHDLYGPKSRKEHFPKADYRFLVRVAANLARVVANVHSNPCVIGDFNHSGVLISQNATVALIDADSFQFELNGKIHPCLVGVPDFTAPELHGKSLSGVVRTKSHDQFALSVAIFQLLFMGRHPYAGYQIKGDLSLAELIAKNMFAYSKSRNTGVTPPRAVADLHDFPPAIADSFEKAFGVAPNLRPSANEWVSRLVELEGHLSKCSANSLHYYPSHSKGCTWCKMENLSGIVLFVTPFIFDANDNRALSQLDTKRIWDEIQKIDIPDDQSVAPQYNFGNLQPTSLARSKNGIVKTKKFFGFLLAVGVGIGATILFPPLFYIWFMVGITIWSKFSDLSADREIFNEKYHSICEQWDKEIESRIQSSGINRLHDIKKDLARNISEYEDLPKLKAQAISKLKIERQNRHLEAYLDKFLLRNAGIAGIGAAKTTTLISFGIETAADVKKEDIIVIPGFGEATAEKLLNWRFSLEKRFIYNPSNTPADQQEQRKVEADFSTKARTLANSIASGQIELTQAALTTKNRLMQGLSILEKIAKEKAQLDTDFKYLGLSAPYRSAPQQTTKPIYKPTVSPATPSHNTGSVSCPHCGSSMIRRTARQGRNRGNQFWGCSRYPSCTGTRP